MTTMLALHAANVRVTTNQVDEDEEWRVEVNGTTCSESKDSPEGLRKSSGALFESTGVSCEVWSANTVLG